MQNTNSEATGWGNAPSKYWLQEFNQAGGNWIDYVGKDPRTTIGEAMTDLRGTRKAFPKRTFRLIIRTDAVIA